MNSVGALRLAATVCPASTWREMTTPSTGATIAVRARSTRADASAASRCLIDRRGVGDLRLPDLHLRVGGSHRLGQRLVVELRLVAFGVRDEAFREQRLLAVEIGLRVVGLDPGAQHLRPQHQQVALLVVERARRGVEIRLRLLHLELEGLRVDPGQQLALLDRAVEVDEELLDLARDLRADGDRRDGGQRSRGGHHRGERAALDLGQPEALCALRAQQQPPGDGDQASERERAEGDREKASPAGCPRRLRGHRGGSGGQKGDPDRLLSCC